MRARFGAVAVCVIAALAGGDAHAGFTPAWSYVPAPLRARLAAQEGGTLFLPARTPLFYRYRSGATIVNGRLSVPFTNRVRIRQGLWKWTKQTFMWTVAPLPQGTACTSWATVAKTFQVDGNKVYWAGDMTSGTAWRCVVDRAGRAHVLAATQVGKSAGAGLATVVASGLDVSRRPAGVNVSLAVTPSTVHRGRTVLVHGLAGGCAEGDAVTIISHAFSASSSFAGVPAVRAEVGSAGRFSVVTSIPAARRPGAYGLTARCGGGNLGVLAELTITR